MGSQLGRMSPLLRPEVTRPRKRKYRRTEYENLTHFMYLQPDGKTMLNHTTISKAGLVVSQVTEQFVKK